PRYPDLPADAYWASGHDGQYTVVVPSADLVVVRTGFAPGGTLDSLGVDEMVARIAGTVSCQSRRIGARRDKHALGRGHGASGGRVRPRGCTRPGEGPVPGQGQLVSRWIR